MPSYDISILTNRERRENATFLLDVWKGAGRPTQWSPAKDWGSAGGVITPRQFFDLLCFHTLATQPAPATVIHADWQRFDNSDVISDVFDDKFDLEIYACDPPVIRADSKGKVIDFVRLKAGESTWMRLFPYPPDPDIVVDVIHAVSGGALKTRAFAVIADMVKWGRWQHEDFRRTAFFPSAQLRKRAVRMGLIDLPERADTFADLKAVSRAVAAIANLSDWDEVHAEPISVSPFRCEICDAARMASCPMPHCRWRREHVEP